MTPSTPAELREVYENWGRGNWTPRFDVYADDFEWGWSSEFPGGLESVKRDDDVPSARLHSWLSPWDDWQCEAEGYVEGGDIVVVLTRHRGRGKGGGVSVGAHVWSMGNGKALRLEVFVSRRLALESAGLA